MTSPALPLLSVVTPAWNEEQNVAPFHRRLTGALAALDQRHEDWEWIVVDDGSLDGTSSAVAAIATRDPRVRGVRLDRNAGSHPAILRGLAESRGAAVFVLAADLQDPPEIATELLAQWRDSARIVWGVRRQRDDEGQVGVALSTLYHALLRRTAGARGLPPGGAGCALFDRIVADALRAAAPPPLDVFAAAGRLHVAAAVVAYDRAPRSHGRSGWSFGKKVRFALRSLAARRQSTSGLPTP